MDKYIEKLKEVTAQKDYLQVVRMLLNWPLFDWVNRYFDRTRDAEKELRFVLFCRSVLDDNHEKLVLNEWQEYDMTLISCELSAYDRLNDFEKYIDLFQDVLANKPYTTTYKKCRNDETFNKYVLFEDSNYKYVHFLYPSDYRYQIILRKQAKQDIGKLPKTMLRHQQKDLGKDTLNERVKELQDLLFCIFKT